MHILFSLLLLTQTCGPQGCPTQSYAPAQQSMSYRQSYMQPFQQNCTTGTCAQQSTAAIQYYQPQATAPRYSAPVTYGPWVPASQYVAPAAATRYYTAPAPKRVIRTTERRPTAEPGPPLDPIPGFSFYKGSSG